MRMTFWPPRGTLYYDDIERFVQKHDLRLVDGEETLDPDEPKPDKYLATAKFSNEHDPSRKATKSIDIVFYKEKVDFLDNKWLPGGVYCVEMNGFKKVESPLNTYFNILP